MDRVWLVFQAEHPGPHLVGDYEMVPGVPRAFSPEAARELLGEERPDGSRRGGAMGIRRANPEEIPGAPAPPRKAARPVGAAARAAAASRDQHVQKEGL